MKTLIGDQPSSYCGSHLDTQHLDRCRVTAHLVNIRKFAWRLLRGSVITPVLVGTVLLSSGHVAIAQILGPSGISVLRVGDRGGEVTALQERLRERGFFVTVDGVYGSETEAAVRDFQASQGLVADGVFGSATEAALFSGIDLPGSVSPNPTDPSLSFGPSQNVAAGTRSLSLGDRGSDVIQLQQRLNERGFTVGAADGDFGLATQAAVERFQISQGLTADGIVGPATWSALGIVANLPSPSPSIPLPPLPPPVFPPLPGTPPGTVPPVIGNGRLTPLETILAEGRYVVVVPGSSSQNLTIIESELGRPGYLTRSARGSFTTPGGYNSYSAARDDALRLRGANLDARVEYFGSR
jgi:peptidoglycan hydrolase-like protein with peptidoglycan-binding domain